MVPKHEIPEHPEGTTNSTVGRRQQHCPKNMWEVKHFSEFPKWTNDLQPKVSDHHKSYITQETVCPTIIQSMKACGEAPFRTELFLWAPT